MKKEKKIICYHLKNKIITLAKYLKWPIFTYYRRELKIHNLTIIWSNEHPSSQRLVTKNVTTFKSQVFWEMTLSQTQECPLFLSPPLPSLVEPIKPATKVNTVYIRIFYDSTCPMTWRNVRDYWVCRQSITDLSTEVLLEFPKILKGNNKNLCKLSPTCLLVFKDNSQFNQDVMLYMTLHQETPERGYRSSSLYRASIRC